MGSLAAFLPFWDHHAAKPDAVASFVVVLVSSEVWLQVAEVYLDQEVLYFELVF